jgi:hypothetical protein
MFERFAAIGARNANELRGLQRLATLHAHARIVIANRRFPAARL